MMGMLNPKKLTQHVPRKKVSHDSIKRHFGDMIKIDNMSASTIGHPKYSSMTKIAMSHTRKQVRS